MGAALEVLRSASRLHWRVKETFWDYVVGVGGTITPVAGASVDGDTAVFERQDTASMESFRFAGGVRFDAHRGALQLCLFDPALRVDGASLTMSAHVSDPTRPAWDIALVDPEDWSVVLTEPGAALFDFRYHPGEQIAPLQLS